MNGASWAGQAQIGGSTPWRVAATGDFNGDGKPDILWQQPSTGELWVWYMSGANWAGQAQISGPTPWKVVGTGDLNGDGKADILWQLPSTGDLWTWFMNGSTYGGAAQLGGATVWTAIGTSYNASVPTVNPSNFSLTLPGPLTITANTSITIPVQIVALYGFSSQVMFNWSNQFAWPVGLTASFQTNPASASTSIIVASNSSTPDGTYSLAFSATGGGLTRTGSVTITKGVGTIVDTSYQTVAAMIALDDGTVYAFFSTYSTGDLADLYSSQITSAYYLSPNGLNSAPRSGTLQHGSVASPVRFPAFSLSPSGFGTYIFTMYSTLCDSYTCWDFRGSGSRNYPTPSLSTLSPNSSLAGNSIQITMTGIGLGTFDEDVVVYKGASSINVSGSGITGSIQPNPISNPSQLTANQVTGVLTINQSAPKGTYQLSLTVFGYTTNALTFTVPDQSPVITGVAELTPLAPGGQAYISIYGTNFGNCPNNLPCSGADVAICNSGAIPCGSSDVGKDSISYWSDGQVNVLLSAAPSALGTYDVVLSAAGPTGNTFLAAPGGQTGAKTNPAR